MRFARVDRFWAQVAKAGPDECWHWTGPKLKSGYGQFYHPENASRSGQILAHRVAYELTHGEYPEVVCHRCDNPSCVNPAHLFGGTHSDNARDMVSKGRHPGGPLTDEQIAYLRDRPKGSPMPQWPGYSGVQLRNAAYWARKGRTYATRRSGH